MKHLFLVYDSSCFYEIIILNYFLAYSKCEVFMVSLDGNPIKTMEGYSFNVDMALKDVERENIRSVIIPGGKVAVISKEEVMEFLKEWKRLLIHLKLVI